MAEKAAQSSPPAFLALQSRPPVQHVVGGQEMTFLEILIVVILVGLVAFRYRGRFGL